MQSWRGVTEVSDRTMLGDAYGDLEGLTRLKRKMEKRHKETKRGALDHLASLRTIEKEDLANVEPLLAFLGELVLAYEDAEEADRLADVEAALERPADTALARPEDVRKRPKGWSRRTRRRVVVEDEARLLEAVREGTVPLEMLQPNTKALQANLDELGELFEIPGTRVETTSSLEFRDVV
jgi:hypothetical protein